MAESDVKNYLKLDYFSFINDVYLYVDVESYLMDKILVDRGIKVKFSKEFYNKTNDYVIITVKVKKKDVNKFLEACSELFDKMKNAGYDDYPDMCSHIQESLNKEFV